MLSLKKFILYSGLAVVMLGRNGLAGEELGPYVPRSHAPLDVRRGGVPPTSDGNADASEFSGEFGGILYMAQRSYRYDRWPGKGLSDCQSVTAGNACGECRLIMGHSNADYYFYRDADGSCTLQQVDAHFQASDPNILKALRRTAQSLLGAPRRDAKVSSREPGWDGEGTGWKWEDENDLAYLYMDTEQVSQGLARFQWRRAPLVKQ